MAAAKKSALSRLGLPGKIALGLVMLSLPWAAYFTLFHSEIQAEINAAQNTNQKLEGELKDALAAEAAYQQDVAELTERERNKRALMKVLPATTEYPAFLSAIQNVANLVGVELIAWTPQEEVPDQFYARVPMKLELKGKFHQIAKFMYNVGQLERIINMENISMKLSKKNETDEVTVDVTVLATAFHAMEEQVSAQGDGKGKGRKNRGGGK
jgi:type IV pilus assembly protein PilO